MGTKNLPLSKLVIRSIYIYLAIQEFGNNQHSGTIVLLRTKQEYRGAELEIHFVAAWIHWGIVNKIPPFCENKPIRRMTKGKQRG